MNINKIEEIISMADIAIPTYVQHLEAVLFWSGIKKEQQKEILKSLKMLRESSKERAKKLEEIKNTFLG